MDLRRDLGLADEARRHQIPLVDGQHDGAARIVGVARDVRVLRRHAFGGVHHEDRDVASLEALERHDHGELLEDFGDPPLAPDAGGVDEEVRAITEGQRRVHRVARRARSLVDEHPLLAEHRVDEGGLADIRSADDRHACALGPALDHRIGHLTAGGFEQLGDPATVLGRNGLDGREAETVEIRERGLLAGGVDLVHREQHGVLAATEDAGDLLVERGQARAAVHDEDDEVGFRDGRQHLVAHGRDQIGLGAGVEAARVHYRRLPALEDGGAVEPVARDPRHVVDEGATAPDEAVEERGFAHVGPAHESDDRTDHGVAGRSAAEQGGGERARRGFDRPHGHAE